MLAVDGLTCGYGRVLAVRDLSFEARPGEALAILGPNGAGKSSTLMAVAGQVAVSAGTIRFDGEDVTTLSPMARCGRGIALAPEGRRLFRDLTVRENLIVGGYVRPARDTHAAMEQVLDLFPRLKERLDNLAGSLSGGEQQMTAIGRAMMAAPRLLLIDEVSLGLMPKNVDICYEALDALRRAGLTIVLVEQSLERVLAMADRVIVLESGRLAWSGTAAEARGNPEVVRAYMGGAAA
ncbi:ABC transporter ATP-binding protein [Rhodoplanes serenus]|uniref:ABC transporter ATP-binding protein n=1 Tax=Rhodoplanes serenus TaxID=200615 RepID=UPI000DADE719|nr:ABC transporter ATP-binding protein [Rhodoplanes serenus]RAI32104.1 ABC transporter ATP-binding protein [Rhodoplanes serenus]